MGFRKDINGLRAIAVLAVVIFHFNSDWLRGGFAGVDVFFVISGYLMTSIIFRGIESGEFSFRKFYAARAKRIIPALAVVSGLLLAYGWLFLPPIPYYDLAKHAGSSLLFISNFIYWNESGYFDAASLDKFLLHTWSLSVEWQFYILYPILLTILSKLISIGSLRRLVVILTVAGFIFSAYSSKNWPTASYFLFPSRAWEMMIGGIAYLYPLRLSNISRSRLEIVAILMIGTSYVFVSDQVAWPGYWAILPVVGAFLLIQANKQDSLITGNYIFQKIGLWSYSIYLVHWPILVMIKKFSYHFNFSTYLIVVIALSLMCYYCVEKKKWLFLKVSIFSMSVALFSGFIIQTNGASSRVDAKYDLTKEQFHEKYYGGNGFLGGDIGYINAGDGNFDYILSGDSYSIQYSNYIKESGKRVATTYGNGCLVMPRVSVIRGGSEDFVCSSVYKELASKMAKSKGTPLIIAHSWDQYSRQLVKKGGEALSPLSQESYIDVILDELSLLIKDGGSDRSYYIVGIPQKPSYNEFECLAASQLMGFKFLSGCAKFRDQVLNDVNLKLKSFSEKVENVTYIDPDDALCSDGQCKMIVDNEPVHSDMGHLSIYGAKIVGKYIFEKIDRIESQSI